MDNYRQEALNNLKNNNISMLNMEVYIQGYIDGRSYNEKELLEMENDNYIEDMKETFRNLGY